MRNAQINTTFLNQVNKKTANLVLDAIAAHYGISTDEARAEVTHDDAEHLLDYMVEPHRSATHVIMKRHGLSK